MSDNNFLFNFNSFSPSVSNPYPYGNTLPPQDCPNGAPVDKYKGYGVNTWEVLYSSWCSFQNSKAVEFTANQCLTGAPTNNDCQGPANIFFMRHGEKSPTTPNYCLDNNGIYRSSQLVNYVNDLAERGHPISYIVTCNPCAFNSSDPSIREQQTIGLVSFMLNIPTFIYGGSQEFSKVVTPLFTSNQYNGLNVLICWEHSAIQQLTLSIINEAGKLKRLPQQIIDAAVDGNYGDAFFKHVNPCPSGHYLAQPSDANYNPTYDPTLANNKLIGENSQNYPYWNNYNFDNVFLLGSSKSDNYEFHFSILKQPCVTCFPSSEYKACLYQPLSISCTPSNRYYSETTEIEDKYQLPIDWKKK
jgi:hypothetical protein